MSNHLITAEAAQGIDLASLAAMIGQQTAGASLNIATLRINKDHEDADGRPIPAGTYCYTGLDGLSIYGKPAHFRPFLQAYQYRRYDEELNKYTNQSVIFTDFRHDAPDERGGNKCGKIPNKLKANLSKEQLEEQEDISCTRLLFGLVTLDGVDYSGKKHTIKDAPVLWRHGGSAFTPVGDAIQGLNKGSAQRLMFNYVFGLDTERQKKGATIYYTPVISVDIKKPVEFTQENFDTLNGFKDYVKEINQAVVKKFEAALRKKKDDSPSDGKTLAQVLSEDFNDELPDHLKDTTVISAA